MSCKHILKTIMKKKNRGYYKVSLTYYGIIHILPTIPISGKDLVISEFRQSARMIPALIARKTNALKIDLLI